MNKDYMCVDHSTLELHKESEICFVLSAHDWCINAL